MKVDEEAGLLEGLNWIEETPSAPLMISVEGDYRHPPKGNL